jgi:GTP cyclohydrolase II
MHSFELRTSSLLPRCSRVTSNPDVIAWPVGLVPINAVVLTGLANFRVVGYSEVGSKRGYGNYGKSFERIVGNEETDRPPGLVEPVLVFAPCYTADSMKPKSGRKKAAKTRKDAMRMIAKAELPTRYGRFTIYGFEGDGPLAEAVALVRGKLNGKSVPLVRVHSQCLTGDVLASERCDCRAQLELSLKKIGAANAGVLLYLPQEGRGIGLMNKLRAYELQDGGMDTVEANETLGFAADARDYDFSAQILKKLGAKRIRLLSNNPEKVRQLESGGIRVVERVPCQPRVSRVSRGYLQTKKRKMGHLLTGV